MALAPLVGRGLDLLGDRIAKRRIEVDSGGRAGRGGQVMGCDGELQQVFTNLVAQRRSTR